MSRPDTPKIDNRFNERLIESVFRIFKEHGFRRSASEEHVSLAIYHVGVAARAYEGNIT
ncbi:MAG TPA: hypothetical protein VGH89_29020 [Pseudonocardia sp.]|jgi:hypothetical protein